MENKFASLCVLAYKRPEKLVDCLSTIRQNTDYPYEIVVNLDADENLRNQDYLMRLYKDKKISKLILNTGMNRGVGRSFANCIGVAEGDYIVKVDTDLTFKPLWLSKAILILEQNKDIGAVSLFNYRNYDPNDTRFTITEDRETCYIVNDFVSSIYIFDKNLLEGTDKWVEDDGFHSYIQSKGYHLAITKEDFVHNDGFGVTKSTYVSGTEDHPYKTPTHESPLIFNKN